MFWIGAAAGVAAALLAVVVGISAIGWSVAKERTGAATDRDKMRDYWQRSIELLEEKNALLADINTELRCIAKK